MKAGIYLARMAVTSVLVVFLGAGSSLAQTPDGETPANEGVCDPLVGGTPGLYGLCVAYCEAQDYLTVDPGEPPSEKILNAYNKRRNSGDPEMPCIQDPCPCWSENDLDIAFPTLTACADHTADADPSLDGVTISGPLPGQLNAARLFIINQSATQDECLFVVQQPDLPISGVFRQMFISKEEGAICDASARQHAEGLGVACE